MKLDRNINHLDFKAVLYLAPELLVPVVVVVHDASHLLAPFLLLDQVQHSSSE